VTTAEPRSVGRTVAFWIALSIVAAGALWLRLEYLWTARYDQAIGGDAFYYHSTANLLASGRGFVNPFVYMFQGGFEQSADHPPLFTLYLAAVSWLGFTSVHDHLVAGALLGVATVVLGGVAGREAGGRVLGILTAVLLAVYPNVWRHDGMVMSETAAIFTTVLSIWLAYRFWWRPSLARAAWLGVAVASAAMARSELALLAVFLVLPLVLWKRDQSLKIRAKWLVASGLAFLLVLAPWVAFNYARFGRPVLLSSQLEVTLATANCPGTYEGQWKGYWDLTCGQAYLDKHGITDPTDPRVPDILMEETKRYVSEHRDEIPSVILARWGRLAGVYQNEQQVEIIDSFIEGGTESVARSGIWTLWVMAGASLVGIVALRVRRIPVTPLIAPILAVWITVTALYTATRFRAPADAALCFLAAAALVGVARAVRWVVRRTGRAMRRSDRSVGPDVAVGSPVGEARDRAPRPVDLTEVDVDHDEALVAPAVTDHPSPRIDDQ
jgi:4-amino-4-deoxy-L-arabinose transferase-like glycosyltransferase